jgi:hypothetical protein
MSLLPKNETRRLKTAANPRLVELFSNYLHDAHVNKEQRFPRFCEGLGKHAWPLRTCAKKIVVVQMQQREIPGLENLENNIVQLVPHAHRDPTQSPLSFLQRKLARKKSFKHKTFTLSQILEYDCHCLLCAASDRQALMVPLLGALLVA